MLQLMELLSIGDNLATEQQQQMWIEENLNSISKYEDGSKYK